MFFHDITVITDADGRARIDTSTLADDVHAGQQTVLITVSGESDEGDEKTELGVEFEPGEHTRFDAMLSEARDIWVAAGEWSGGALSATLTVFSKPFKRIRVLIGSAGRFIGRNVSCRACKIAVRIALTALAGLAGLALTDVATGAAAQAMATAETAHQLGRKVVDFIRNALGPQAWDEITAFLNAAANVTGRIKDWIDAVLEEICTRLGFCGP